MGQLRIEVRKTVHAPVTTSRQSIVGRPSLSACWITDFGPIYGEATPLARYGDDDFLVARRELSGITHDLLKASAAQVAHAFASQSSRPEFDVVKICDPLSELSHRLKSPSARFCVEMLVLGAAARSCGEPMWRLLSPECVSPRLQTSSVIDTAAIDWQRKWRSEMQRGVRTFKVKCGIDDERERRAFDTLACSEQPFRIRLDPNGGWTFATAKRLLLSLPSDLVEWVEDPTSDPSQWKLLRSETGVSIAADEILASGTSEDMAAEIDPDVIVLKPMALGGALACLRWARFASRQEKSVSVSHLFDGRAAMSAAIHLAFALQTPQFAAGLGRHVGLENPRDPAPFPPEVGDFELLCPANFSGP